MAEVSVLGPIDPSSVVDSENEKNAPWIVRKLVGSMTGRIVRSSLESLKATGTSVVCLSPWGDSNPLLLPCVRFRDLAVHAIVIGTGGVAAVAAPVMGPAADIATSAFGGSILVEIGLSAGFQATAKTARELVVSKTLNRIIPEHAEKLITTGVKVVTITLKHKLTLEDANLGFFRGSKHEDSSLFASVKDYLSTQKGWFSPYLFASARRPAIPRSMNPDFVFCHGPFLSGDYEVGTTLHNESALAITLCTPSPTDASLKNPSQEEDSNEGVRARLAASLPSLSKYMPHLRSRSPSPEPALAVPQPQTSLNPGAAPEATIPPRRLVVLFVGIKPFRKLWTGSARPGESVLRYVLFNGCPAVVLPAKLGSPLIAWHAMTLEQLKELKTSTEGEAGGDSEEESFTRVANVLYEYASLCVDWERVVLPATVDEEGEAELGSADCETGELQQKQAVVKNALTTLLLSAVRCKGSKDVEEEADDERAGIVIIRIL